MGKVSRADRLCLDRLLRHREWLQHLARSLTLDESQADEVVQQTWLAAIRSSGKNIEIIRNPRSWLGTVAKRKLFSLWSSRVVASKREKRVAREEVVSGEFHHVDQEDTQRVLVAAVSELKEPYRSTLILHFFDGFSYEEIARRKVIAEATVRSHIKRGLDQLRVRLDSRFGDRGNWAILLLPLASGSSLAMVSRRASGLGKRSVRYSWAAAILMILSIPVVVLTLPRGQESLGESNPLVMNESPFAAVFEKGGRSAIDSDAFSTTSYPALSEPSTDREPWPFLEDISGPGPSATESLPKKGKIELETGERASELSKTTEKPRRARSSYSPKVTPLKSPSQN